MVEFSTLTWQKEEVIVPKTLSLPKDKIMVNHIWCKVFAAHKNNIMNQLKGNAKQSAQAFNTKHQVWIFSIFFIKQSNS